MFAASLPPRTSAEFVMKRANNVVINKSKVMELANTLLSSSEVDADVNNERAFQDRWNSHPLNPKIGKNMPEESIVDWLFVVDALNFSFWSVDQANKYSVTWGGERYTGYWSLCAAVNRALAEGIPITSSEFYSAVSEEQLAHVFRSDNSTSIPMLKERHGVLHEVGAILNAKWGGSFVNCIRKANGKAEALLDIITSEFPVFRDECMYENQQVSFYKRAQILIADLWACFGGRGLGAFTDIDVITMFADYRIPQALAYFGILEYSESLQKLLKADHMFTYGNPMECELRAASILAVDQLCTEMHRLAEESQQKIFVNAIILDHFMWDYRRQHDTKTSAIPFHKVRCIYY